MSLEIQPLCLGETAVDPSFVVFGWNPGKRVDIPFSAYLILGGSTPILVDAGMRKVEGQEFDVASGPTIEDRHDITTQLQRHGVEPADVGIVVLTHLHVDHTGYLDLFPSAKLVIQRDELRYSAAPLAPEYLFDRTDIAKLVGPLFGQIELINGDEPIAEGVRAVVTGGHSPVHQMIYVDLASGQAVITGDAVYLAEPALEMNAPPGYVVDLGDALAALDRIRKDADHVLPMHDFAVFEKYPDGVR